MDLLINNCSKRTHDMGFYGYEQSLRFLVTDYEESQLKDDAVYFSTLIWNNDWDKSDLVPDLLLNITDLPDDAKVTFAGSPIIVKNNSVSVNKLVPLCVAPFQKFKITNKNDKPIDVKVSGYMIMNLDKRAELLEHNKTESYACRIGNKEFNFFNGVAYSKS